MIRDRTQELRQLHFEHTPREEPSSNGHKPPPADAAKSDEEVIEKVRGERNGKFERLWKGDLSDYADDHSSADDAFVHKLYSYTQDPEQVKRIHAVSGLHRPEKSGRRTDYLDRSIKRAGKNVSWFYEWPEAGRRRALGSSKSSESGTEATQGPHGTLLSEVVPERVRWLWESRIALGKLNLIDGDPGLGKSAVTVDLAARVSVGKAWPDGSECEAGGVVILSAEDGLSDTIRPRFDAAGGDPEKAVALFTIPDAEGNERQIAIPYDISAVVEAIERVEAVLVVIDPLMAFLPGDVNSHRDQDVRRALAPLSKMAEYTGVAIVVVRHLNKATGGNALYRGGGSIGIVGAARSGLLIAKHPEDDGRRVMASIKSNLAAPASSLVFGLSSTETGAVRVDWKGESTLDASALLSAPVDQEERSAASEAQEFLREMLEEGSEAVSDIRKQANEAGLSWRTVERAKAALGVQAEREGTSGKRGGGSWVWTLPTIKTATPGGWRSKPDADRTDGSNTAYIKEKESSILRPPSPPTINTANGVGGLKDALSVEEVGVETSRANSGPAKALATYLDKPSDERLQWLTKAVLTARGMDTQDYERHAGAVKEAAQLLGTPSTIRSVASVRSVCEDESKRLRKAVSGTDTPARSPHRMARLPHLRQSPQHAGLPGPRIRSSPRRRLRGVEVRERQASLRTGCVARSFGAL